MSIVNEISDCLSEENIWVAASDNDIERVKALITGSVHGVDDKVCMCSICIITIYTDYKNVLLLRNCSMYSLFCMYCVLNMRFYFVLFY